MNYVGTELELFQHATNWKSYWSRIIRPFVQGSVLDVGCGFGTNASHVLNDKVTGYTFLEPDADLLQQVAQRVTVPAHLPQRSIHGTTADLRGEYFDTLLYIDVLEHIEDADRELHRAFDLLTSGGHLVILVPAFQFLYSPFDKAIGHFRRYTERMLRSQAPAALTEIRMRYLDSAGLFLSLGNRLLLRQAAPTASQIAFWDKRIIPVSRFTDRFVGHGFGRSLIAVYRKP